MKGYTFLNASPDLQIASMVNRRRVGNRYEILEELAPNSFRGYDVEQNESVLIRRVAFPLQSDPETWREGVRKLLTIRHPNFLNILELVSERDQDYVITERSPGISAADLRKEGIQFTPDEALRLLLGLGGGFDLAAQYTLLPNFISSNGLFIESDEPSDLKRLSVSEWPSVRLRLDIFTLLKPTLFSIPFPEGQEVTTLAVRQAALMLYNLLSGTQPKHGAVNLWFKPLPTLTEAANSALFGGLEWSPVFENSENFLRSVDFANKKRLMKKATVLPELIDLSVPPIKKRLLKGFGLSGSAIVFGAGAVFAATVFTLFPLNRPSSHTSPEIISTVKTAESTPDPQPVEPAPLKPELRSLTQTAPAQSAPDPVSPEANIPTHTAPAEIATRESSTAENPVSVIAPQDDAAKTIIQIPLIVPVAAGTGTPVQLVDVSQDRTRIAKKTRSHSRGETRFDTRQEVLTDVDSKWIPREVAANLRVATVSAKISAVTGPKKVSLVKYREYLKRREAYVHRMHRYERDIARRTWNREHGNGSVLDSIVATLGF
jgi:hypothetical protein